MNLQDRVCRTESCRTKDVGRKSAEIKDLEWKVAVLKIIRPESAGQKAVEQKVAGSAGLYVGCRTEYYRIKIVIGQSAGLQDDDVKLQDLRM